VAGHLKSLQKVVLDGSSPQPWTTSRRRVHISYTLFRPIVTHHYTFMCNVDYDGYFCFGQDVLVEGTVFPTWHTALILLALGGKGPVLLPSQVAIEWLSLPASPPEPRPQLYCGTGAGWGWIQVWLPIHVPQQQPVLVSDQLRWPCQHFPEAEGTNSLCAAREVEQQPRHRVTSLHIHLLPVLWPVFIEYFTLFFRLCSISCTIISDIFNTSLNNDTEIKSIGFA